MEKRILFTGVGRRIELLQEFRQAALCLDIDLKIYGADFSESAPALLFCDFSRKVCDMKSPEYIPQLLKICQEDNIDLIIPTIDTDLSVLAENSDKFEKVGTKVLISKADKIKICRDKNCTAEFFKSCGLNTPQTYNQIKKYFGPYPCFIKPKDGSSSINAYKVHTADELKIFAEKIGDYIIQPFIDGTEYTVDIFCDFDGKPVYVTPRIRTAVRSGEVLKTEICMDKSIIDESLMLIRKFKPCGPLTVQLIRKKDTNIDYFIEINPRYGGGAPLSMKAGASSAETVLELLSNVESLSRNEISDGAIFSRFDRSVCIKSGSLRKLRGIIFDLDDTLYSEKEYVKSGFSAVARYLKKPSYADRMWAYFEEGKQAIDFLLRDENLEYEKEKCLEVYREHEPNITPYEWVFETLKKCRNSGIKLGIITDGRVSAQKKKIHALGLEHLIDDIIITDELGGIQFRKPNDISFRIMQRRWRIPFEQILYVGDNPNKDFQAPRQLGMQIEIFKNPDGIYYNYSAETLTK